jgi:hypothetical protein
LKLLTIKGFYHGDGKIMFDNDRIFNLNGIADNITTELALGSSLEISFAFDEEEFLSGKNGIVWATSDLRQAEIIQNALLAMQINSEITNQTFEKNVMFFLKIINEADNDDAIDFIWRSISGLRLKPDWTYHNGETNKSFEQWLSGQ